MRSRSASRRVILAAVALLSPSAVVTSWFTPFRPVLAADADEEFRKGVKAFEEGRFEDAERSFREVLKAKPSDEQARLYRDEAGYHFWVKVLAANNNMSTLGKRILAAAERGAIRERQDDEKISASLQRFWSDDFMTQMEAQEEIIAKHGAYVVPKLIESLGERREDDKRVRVIGLLSRLGEEGVLAVLQCLKSENELTRQNACIILGNVRDWRALPQLMKVAEKDADSHVKAEASAAIAKIGQGKSTAEMFAYVADRFYKEHPLVMINRFKEWCSWKWKDGKLAFKDEPRPIWNDKIAQEYAFEGLSVAPNDDALWSILVSSYAQEWAKLDEITRVAQQKKDKGAEIDETEIAKLTEAMKGGKKKLMAAAMSAGIPRIFNALKKALEDGNSQVAVKLIEMCQMLNVTAEMLPGGGSVSIAQKPNAADFGPVDAKQPEKTDVPSGASDSAAPSTPATPSVEKPADSSSGGDKPAETKPPEGEKKDEPKPVDGDGAKPADQPKEGEQPAGPRPKRVSARPSDELPNGAKRTVYAEVGPGSGGAAGGESLCASLNYHDKRVRYAAAIALAHLNPAKPFANQEKVVENLMDALSETGQRVVLVVEKDLEIKNKIVGELREAGYMVFSTQSGLDGLNRAKSFPAEDLIIVSSELNTNPDGSMASGADPLEFQFIQELQNDYRTKTIPCIVLTPSRRVGDMQKLVDEKLAADVVTPEVDRVTLDGKIKKIFEAEEYKRDEKARNDDVAKRAALALAAIPQDHTVLDVAKAGPALANCLNPSRPDDVKIAAMKAIASIGPKVRGACLDSLLLVFKDKNLSVDVREAAANAIGEVVKGQALQGDGFKTLKEGFGEEEDRIWSAVGKALGKAELTGDQRREVFEQHRVE